MKTFDLILCLSVAITAATIHLVTGLGGRAILAGQTHGLRRVRGLNALFALGAMATIVASEDTALRLAAILGAAVVPAVALVIAIVGAAAKTKPETPPSRFLVPLAGPPKLRTLASPLLALMNVVVIAIPSAIFALLVDTLPDRIPMHWNAAGRLDGSGRPEALWFFPVLMASHLLVFGAIAALSNRERWIVSEREPERYAELAVEKRRLMLRLFEALVLSINGGMALLWMTMIIGARMGRPKVALVGVVGAILGSAGSLVVVAILLPKLIAIAKQQREIAGTNTLGTRPQGWRWHRLIYWAPEDPSLFVPKSSGVGLTLNFARPMAWVMIGGLVALPMLVSAVAAALR